MANPPSTLLTLFLISIFLPDVTDGFCLGMTYMQLSWPYGFLDLQCFFRVEFPVFLNLFWVLSFSAFLEGGVEQGFQILPIRR